MPKPYRPRIPRREMTSDKSSRKRQAKRSLSNLLSVGYRGNPADRTESMYLRGGPKPSVSAPLREGASSHRQRRRRRSSNTRAY